MKYRLPALLAVAAVLAAPAIASAATARDAMLSNAIASGPAISTVDDDNAAMDSANAEHAYLASVCPTVLSHQGSYSATLVRFCQEAKS